MTFKVGDKVRCIDDMSSNYLCVGSIYSITELLKGHIYLVNDGGINIGRCPDNRFELVQEDKLPHELLGLDRYRVVEKDESDPLWGLFLKWLNREFNVGRSGIFLFYGYDGGDCDSGTYGDNNIKHFKNNPTLITLAERDRCVNKKEDIQDTSNHLTDALRYSLSEQFKQKPSQTKKISEKYTYTNQVLRSDGVLFTPDEIGGEKVSDIKERYNRDRSLLRKHKDLFSN